METVSRFNLPESGIGLIWEELTNANPRRIEMFLPQTNFFYNVTLDVESNEELRSLAPGNWISYEYVDRTNPDTPQRLMGIKRELKEPFRAPVVNGKCEPLVTIVIPEMAHHVEGLGQNMAWSIDVGPILLIGCPNEEVYTGTLLRVTVKRDEDLTKDSPTSLVALKSEITTPSAKEMRTSTKLETMNKQLDEYIKRVNEDTLRQQQKFRQLKLKQDGAVHDASPRAPLPTTGDGWVDNAPSTSELDSVFRPTTAKTKKAYLYDPVKKEKYDLKHGLLLDQRAHRAVIYYLGKSGDPKFPFAGLAYAPTLGTLYLKSTMEKAGLHNFKTNEYCAMRVEVDPKTLIYVADELMVPERLMFEAKARNRTREDGKTFPGLEMRLYLDLSQIQDKSEDGQTMYIIHHSFALNIIVQRSVAAQLKKTCIDQGVTGIIGHVWHDETTKENPLSALAELMIIESTDPEVVAQFRAEDSKKNSAAHQKDVPAPREAPREGDSSPDDLVKIVSTPYDFDDDDDCDDSDEEPADEEHIHHKPPPNAALHLSGPFGKPHVGNWPNELREADSSRNNDHGWGHDQFGSGSFGFGSGGGFDDGSRHNEERRYTHRNRTPVDWNIDQDHNNGGRDRERYSPPRSDSRRRDDYSARDRASPNNYVEDPRRDDRSDSRRRDERSTRERETPDNYHGEPRRERRTQEPEARVLETKTVRGVIAIFSARSALIWTEQKETVVYNGNIKNNENLCLGDTIECRVERIEGAEGARWKVINSPPPVKIGNIFNAAVLMQNATDCIVPAVITVPDEFKDEEEEGGCYPFLHSDRFGDIIAASKQNTSLDIADPGGRKISLYQLAHNVKYNVWLKSASCEGQIKWEPYSIDCDKMNLKSKDVEHGDPCGVTVSGPTRPRPRAQAGLPGALPRQVSIDSEVVDPEEFQKMKEMLQEMWNYKNVREAVRDANSYLFKVAEKWSKKNPRPDSD